ncbi:MAG: hypothetical protein EBZ77_03230, partial [Chitinophagia bacterium]|nr:hypothetical protein [Chitinophagia bacterium]
MATKVKPKSAPATEPKKPAVQINPARVRLGAGIFFLAAGVYVCLCIISYYTSWSMDQDKFLTTVNNASLVAEKAGNRGGNIGALIGHMLVYQGAGIASFVVGIFLSAIGLTLLLKKKGAAIFKYMRWVSIFLLLTAPTLTFLFPNTTFPIGGALGKVLIMKLETMIGPAGTGILLLSVIIFFVFVIFALDLGP